MCAVVIGITRRTEAARRLNEGVTQRVSPVAIRDWKQSIRAAIASVVCSDSPLGSLEIRQHLDVAPTAIAALCPTVEVIGTTPVVVHPVDGGRAAERLALRHRYRAIRRRGV